MAGSQPGWLDPGEFIVRSERAQARIQADGSIVRKTRRGRFYLTNRRIVGLLFGRWRTANIPLSRIQRWEAADVMRGRASYWSASRRLLLLQVAAGADQVAVGIAVRDAADWVEQLDELVPPAS